MTVRKPQILLYTLSVLLFLAIFPVSYLTSRQPEQTARALLILLSLTLACSFAGMLLALRASVRSNLYSYKNVCLTGFLFFNGSLLGVMILRSAIGLFGSHPLDLDYELDMFLSFPRLFSYVAVFVILAVSVLIGISNVALLRHEGFRPKNALSLVLAFFYIGGTLFVYWLIRFLADSVFRPSGLLDEPVFATVFSGICLCLILIVCYFECVFAGSAVMAFLAVKHVPSYDKDYIIILGCSIDRRGGLLPLLKGRTNRAIRFAWDQEIATGKPVKYVPSGGQGPNEIMSEGSAMELYLLAHGAEPNEILPEKASRNTRENMRFSKALIEKEHPGAKVAFATTNYHVFRSGILASEEGLDAEGIASRTRWYFWPNGYLREFIGLLSMNVRAHLTAMAAIVLACAAVILIKLRLGGTF